MEPDSANLGALSESEKIQKKSMILSSNIYFHLFLYQCYKCYNYKSMNQQKPIDILNGLNSASWLLQLWMSQNMQKLGNKK